MGENKHRVGFFKCHLWNHFHSYDQLCFFSKYYLKNYLWMIVKYVKICLSYYRNYTISAHIFPILRNQTRLLVSFVSIWDKFSVVQLFGLNKNLWKALYLSTISICSFIFCLVSTISIHKQSFWSNICNSSERYW